MPPPPKEEDTTYLAVTTDPDGFPLDFHNFPPERKAMYMDHYKTLAPTIKQQLRFHLHGVCGWNQGWVFKPLSSLGHKGEPMDITIGNCVQCGIAGRTDNKCFGCGKTLRVPVVNCHGYVVHPCIVAYFCGHHDPDWMEPDDEDEVDLPAMEYLFHWLDFGWCMSHRPPLTDSKLPNTMSDRDIALFKMIQEYDGDQKDY